MKFSHGRLPGVLTPALIEILPGLEKIVAKSLGLKILTFNSKGIKILHGSLQNLDLIGFIGKILSRSDLQAKKSG